MIGLTAFFAGHRIATRHIAAGACEQLCIGEVVIDRRRQVVPAEQDEASLAACQSRARLDAVALAVNGDEVSGVQLGVEGDATLGEEPALSLLATTVRALTMLPV